MTKALEKAIEYADSFVYTINHRSDCVDAYFDGYKQAEKDIIALIESRLSEILGDAQPKPALRAELQELINKIKK